MVAPPPPGPLPAYKVDKGGNSVSGLSSGAFMTVQLQLAHSSSFIGAGVIAGGPYRCVESFLGSAPVAEDAFVMNAEYICMAPLTPQTGPDVRRLADLARETAEAGRIDPLSHLASQKLYIFTGSRDTVVASAVVQATRDFYREVGVPLANIRYVGDQPAGHSILTDNVEDQPMDANRPPYINYGGYMQSHEILTHIYGKLNPPADTLSSSLIRFDQRPFFAEAGARASMGPVGFAYVPNAVRNGKSARGVHVVLHGCKQGYSYVEYVNGLSARGDQPPYGARYISSTGYNAWAEGNDLIVLYPQARAADSNAAQNPDGCWDWWGYSSRDVQAPDYYSKKAVQISAIHGMLTQIGAV